jgi:hypothetical protein
MPNGLGKPSHVFGREREWRRWPTSPPTRAGGDPGHRQRAAAPGEDLPAPVARRRYRRLLLRGGRGHRGRVAADVRRGAGQAGRLPAISPSPAGRTRSGTSSPWPARTGPADHRRVSLPGKGQSRAALLLRREIDRPRAFAGRRSRARILLCGSAMSVMGGLLAGNAPLRGRAAWRWSSSRSATVTRPGSGG